GAHATRRHRAASLEAARHHPRACAPLPRLRMASERGMHCRLPGMDGPSFARALRMRLPVSTSGGQARGSAVASRVIELVVVPTAPADAEPGAREDTDRVGMV